MTKQRIARTAYIVGKVHPWFSTPPRLLGEVAHLFCLVFGESNDDGMPKPCLRCLFRVLALQLNDLRLQPFDFRLQLNDIRLELLHFLAR